MTQGHQSSPGGVHHAETDASVGLLAADGPWRQLDPAWLQLARLRLWLRLGVVTAAGGAVLGLGWWLSGELGAALRLSAIGWVALLVLLGVLGVIRPRLHFRHAAWRLDARGLEVRGGAFWRHATAVTRSRIQHADVTQGPLERRYGLASLNVHTAGSGHQSIGTGGIRHADAIAVRDHLLAGEADATS